MSTAAVLEVAGSPEDAAKRLQDARPSGWGCAGEVGGISRSCADRGPSGGVGGVGSGHGRRETSRESRAVNAGPARAGPQRPGLMDPAAGRTLTGPGPRPHPCRVGQDRATRRWSGVPAGLPHPGALLAR